MGINKAISSFYFLLIFISSLNFGPFRISSPIFCKAKCVWYGLCGGLPKTPWKILNCAYDGPAKPANEKVVSILKKWCPHYFEKEKGTSMNTCCDEEQMNSFEHQIVQASVLMGRCPSCQYNFIEHVCELTCRPDQHIFLQLLNTSETSTGKIGVSEVNLHITKKYAYETFASCKNLYLPLANHYALDILCNRPAVTCTPELWFEFTGSVEAFSPFQINYKITNAEIEEFTPLSIKTYPCNEKPLENLTSCSCLDCLESCPPPNTIISNNPTYVGSILLEHFFIICFFIAGEAIIIYLLTFYWRREQRERRIKKCACLRVLFSKVRNGLKKLKDAGAVMEQKMEKMYNILGQSKTCVNSKITIGFVCENILRLLIIFLCTEDQVPIQYHVRY